MKKFWVLSATVIAIAMSAQQVRATPIIYTESGTAQGTLNGTPFNTTLTFTTVSDTSNITFAVLGGGTVPTYFNSGTTTVNVQGLGVATLTGSSYGAYSHDFHAYGLGQAMGIMDITQLAYVMYNAASLPFYSMTSQRAQRFQASGKFIPPHIRRQRAR